MCFNQFKKEDGPSCAPSPACADAAAHNKKVRDNVAARKIPGFTGMPLPEQATMAV